MKLLAISFALLTVTVLAAQSQPPAPGPLILSQDQQKPGEKIGPEPKSNQAASQPAGTRPQATQLQPIVQQTGNAQDRNPPRSYAQEITNVLLVIVGGLQFWVMRRQAEVAADQNRIIDRQTEHISAQANRMAETLEVTRAALRLSEESAKSQAADMKASIDATRLAAEATQASVEQSERHFRLVNQQWLKTINWYAELRKTDDGKQFFEFGFVPLNPTPMAVTLMSVQWSMFVTNPIIFLPNGQPDLREMRGDGGNLPMGSIKDGKVSGTVLPPGPAEWGVPVGKYYLDRAEKVEAVSKGNLKISFNGTLTFIDAFDREQAQPIGAMCRIGPNGATFTSAAMGITHLPHVNVWGKPTDIKNMPERD